MEDDDKLRSDVERGRRAKALLEDELLQESLEYVLEAYVDGWKKCKTVELRETAWALTQAAEKFRDHLTTVLNNGVLSDRQIHELVTRQPGRPRAA